MLQSQAYQPHGPGYLSRPGAPLNRSFGSLSYHSTIPSAKSFSSSQECPAPFITAFEDQTVAAVRITFDKHYHKSIMYRICALDPDSLATPYGLGSSCLLIYRISMITP
jgi:hypothetical protein